jgi:hypothetical protein
MEMNPQILPTISPGNRRRENARLQIIKKRYNAVREEMRLEGRIQEQYDKTPFGDERDQLEFNFECPKNEEDDACNCYKCRL